MRSELCGVIPVNKPSGWTSSAVVRHFRGLLGGRSRRDVRIGHAGTLDPAAGGVLVLLVGRATRLTELLMGAGKEYAAAVRLGAVSTTDDGDGEIAETRNAEPPNESAVRETLARFVGTIQQTPPSHSAIRVGGRRAYKLARGGKSVQLAARAVTIHSIDLLEYDWPTVRLRVACGRGVYIRSLARDLGEALGVGGYLATLKRTRVGPFGIESAARPEECSAANVSQWLRPVSEAVAFLPRIELSAEQAATIGRLNLANDPALPRPPADGLAAMFDPAGRCVGLADYRDGRLMRTWMLETRQIER